MPVTIDTIEQYFTGTWIASHITEAMVLVLVDDEYADYPGQTIYVCEDYIETLY